MVKSVAKEVLKEIQAVILSASGTSPPLPRLITKSRENKF